MTGMETFALVVSIVSGVIGIVVGVAALARRIRSWLRKLLSKPAAQSTAQGYDANARRRRSSSFGLL